MAAIVKPLLAHVEMHMSFVMFGSVVANPVSARWPPSTTQPEATQVPDPLDEPLLELEFEPETADVLAGGAAAEEVEAPLVKRLSDQVPPHLELLSPAQDM